MRAPPKTKTSTPRLSDLARHVVAPSGVVKSGWPAVRDKCRELGISFRPWQHGAGRLILAKRDNGKYASTIGGTGMSIPRQVGKTFLVGAIAFALCIIRPNLTVLWTAHRLRTAEETFGKMQAFARRRKIAPHVAKVVLGSGEEAILFHNGSRILFGARERGFGLGFDEVDVEVFDEAQRLTEGALDDMIPATNQSRQDTGALLLFMGTPPRPTDAGEVFTRMRTEALSGEDEDTAWIEFGADGDFEPTEAPAPMTEADWRQIGKANPSFPEDTPRESIMRMRKQLTPESMKREGYGIWDEISTSEAFGPGGWADIEDLNAPQPPVGAIGLAVAADRLSASIAGAGMGEHPMIGAVDERPGTGWLVAAAKRLQDDHDVDVVLDGKGPAADLIPALEAAGVRITIASTSDMLDGCALIFDRVTDRSIRQPGHPEIDKAVAGAATRNVGDRWVWDRRRSKTNVAMLEAATLALWKLLGIDDEKPPPATPQVARDEHMSETASLMNAGF